VRLSVRASRSFSPKSSHVLSFSKERILCAFELEDEFLHPRIHALDTS
jgi:hypothetical protein